MARVNIDSLLLLSYRRFTHRFPGSPMSSAVSHSEFSNTASTCLTTSGRKP
jgi:hypothetical protein